MRKVAKRIGVFCVIGLLLLVSACSMKSVRRETGTTPNETETTASATTVTPEPTSRPMATATLKPTPTSKPTSTPKPMATPTPTIDPFQAMITFGDQNAEKAFYDSRG